MFKLRKIEICILIGIILLFCGLAYAFFAMEIITVSDSVKTLTAGTYGDANQALLTLEDASIRFTLDGVTMPNTTMGHQMLPLQSLKLVNNFQIRNFKCIRETADAKLTVTYEYTE
jgi:hypothetical protein